MPSNRSLADRLRNEMQVEATGALGDIFREEPPPLEEFVTGRRYMNSPHTPLSPIQYQAVRHAEQILLRETYPLMVEEWGEYWTPVRFVNFVTLEWGKGSGKDHICRVIVSRAVNLLECMHSPQDYFTLPPTDFIHALNVASSAGQAHRAFFKPFVQMVKASPWFMSRVVSEPGEQATSLTFKNRIEAVSGHSAASTQEGLNLIVGVADEISEFRTKEEIERFHKGAREPSKSAENIINMMRSSARTRFPSNFKLCQISYPRFINDAIQQARKKGEADVLKHGDKSRYYVSGPEKTWHVNPRYLKEPFVTAPHNPTYEIPEAYLDDYEDDPVEAMAKYECLPPKVTGDVYFRNKQKIIDTFSEVLDPEPVTIEYWWGISPEQREEAKRNGTAVTPGWNVKFRISPDLRPIQGALYSMHGDIGINTDAAGIALAHCVGLVDSTKLITKEDGEEFELTEKKPLIKVDFVTSFEGDRTAKGPDGMTAARDVQISWYRELCWELIRRGFNIKRYTYDGFQSTDSMQILARRGIETKRVSTDINTDVWSTLKDVMYDNRLQAYYRGRVVTELQELVKLPNGKVDHPVQGSKDEADALGGAVFGAVELGGYESEEKRIAHVTDTQSYFSTSSPFSSAPVGMDETPIFRPLR